VGCVPHAAAETAGVAAGAAETGSETMGSSTAGSSALASVAGSVAAGSGTAGVSVVGVLAFGFLKVLRKPLNGDLGFSFSPSESLVAFSFLLNHGREDLRLSLAATGVSAALVSPLVIGAVSAGTVAGVKVDAANGSVASTAGITGAVSLTGSSFAGTAGAEASASDLVSFFGANLAPIVPKMLLRLEAVAFGSVALAGTAAVSGTGSVPA